MPQFTPTNWFSARWQSNAFFTGSSFHPPSASKTVATPHSSAAEELKPLLMGTVLWMTPSKPESLRPSACNTCATPRT